MPVINKGTALSNGEQLTAEKLNDLLDLATFSQTATDGVSTFVNSSGQIAVLDGGISATKLATNAVNTTKILNANVTKAKLENMSAPLKVLGRTTAGAGAVEEVAILDEDDLVSNSAIALATQQSIKAYVDATRSKYVQLTGGTLALDSGNQIAGTSTYNIADFTSNDVDFTTSSITAIVIFGYAGSDVEVEAFVKATLPSGQETDIASIHDFGSNDNKGRQGSSFSLPINKGQSSFNIRYSGGTACSSLILGAIIN